MVFEKLTEGVSPRVFGDDYPTPDGTCVRDYIHVVDLAEAHVAAARALRPSPGRDLTLNIGRGEGVSVREMIDRVNALTGHDRPPVVAARRPGDPPRVVASADRAAAELGWKARHGIDDMITSAWAGWTRLHPAAAHG
ncbi:UDP-glucose 4-epimerase OS=Streptomyces griseomycini OX=66895 GN=FHS37_005270 PE=3 SV=1 [Streptomyces griseomycini]